MRRLFAFAAIVVALLTFTAAAPANTCACGGAYPTCVYFQYSPGPGWFYWTGSGWSRC